MRKGQLTILEKAKAQRLPKELIDFLSDEKLPLQDLNICYQYICGQQTYPSEIILSELSRCLNWHKETKAPLHLLLPVHDSLIGRKEKRRMIRYQQFFAGKDRAFDRFFWYRSLLNWYIPPLWISRLCKEGRHWLIHQLADHPFLYEDFVYNDEHSLFAGLYRKNVSLFYPDIWESWYDTETHAFPFEIPDDALHDEECQYAFLNEQACMQSPLFQQIRDFMDKNHAQNGMIRSLRHPEQEKAVKAAVELLQASMDIKIPAYSIQYQINCKRGGGINLSMRKTRQIHAYKNLKGVEWCPKSVDGKDCPIELFLTPDDHIYKKQKIRGKKRYIPLSAQEFFELRREEGLDGELMQLILDHYSIKYPFYRDFEADCKEGCLIPVAFHEIKEYHNRTEFMEQRYKLAKELRVNWNRRNLNLSYMIVKTYPKVIPGKSREILTQLSDTQLLIKLQNCYFKMPLEAKTDHFLTNIIYGRLCQSHEELDGSLLQLTGDYLRMASQAKIKPRLDIYTVRQLEKLHDAMTEMYYQKCTKPVHIPKDTKFKALRKLLPPEFEWIKTRKRLIAETAMQHHCVWSYADLMTNDTCAIYSFLDKDGTYSKDDTRGRYTMEFRMYKNGTYVLEQVQGTCNRTDTELIADYVKALLSHQQQKAA